MNDSEAYREMAFAHNPYGDGTACVKIMDALIDFERKKDSD